MKFNAHGSPRIFAVLAIACSVLAIGACHEDPHLQGESVAPPSGSDNIALQLGDCSVYRITRSFFSTKIEEALSLEFYLGPTMCTSQSLIVDQGYAVATLCRQALGAGGGCARGGTYRTSDGFNWEKLNSQDSWVAVQDGGYALSAEAIAGIHKTVTLPYPSTCNDTGLRGACRSAREIFQVQPARLQRWRSFFAGSSKLAITGSPIDAISRRSKMSSYAVVLRLPRG